MTEIALLITVIANGAILYYFIQNNRMWRDLATDQGIALMKAKAELRDIARTL